MDDYFAEADEHLLAIRRCLLMLDGVERPDPSSAVLEELFRSCHSLKGISAMVELREAEVLAHHMESCLRAIRQGETTLGPANLETLLAGANALEAVIVARREGQPPPTNAHVIAGLRGMTSTQAGARVLESPSGGTPVESVRSWAVRFVPSPELVARGIKVDTIRARLLEIGKIASVAPQVLSGGGISFEFHVETEDEASLAAWEDDGVSYELIARHEPEPAIPGATATELPSGPRAWEMGSAAPGNFVRVDLARLDDLMRLVGDLVVTRSRLDDTLGRIERHMPSREFRLLQEHDLLMERQLRDLREGIMRVRLVPVGEVFRRMPFVVRDLAHDIGKRVTLEIKGQGTEIDKFLIERMMDPILHLVRNAVGHGIETVDRRVAAGKPPEGTIRLGASTVGESVVIEIADDGAGIDLAAIARRSPKGVHVEDGTVDPRLLLDVICESGFSTREEADRISGRGVGMAVVRSTVEDLGGTLEVDTEPGRGTRFAITLPLTLAIIDAIIAHVGDQTFAVPQSAVQEVIEIDPDKLRPLEQNELITHRGRALPIIRLGRLFRLETAPRPRLHAVVVGTGLSAMGLVVDRVAGHREIVVKPIIDPLIHVSGVSGATELGDGRLVLILDVAALSRGVRERPRVGERASA